MPHVRLGAGFAAPGLTISALVSLALLLRVALAQRLSFQVDEAASILAAKMVAERGIPLLPSGALYLQGTPMSYVLAPLIWLGFGDLSQLTVLRLGCAAAGVVAVYASFRTALLLIDWPLVAGFIALLVALDPVSAEWSAHARMYAPLQALTMVLAWQLAALLQSPSGRRLAVVTSLTWAAMLTHAAAVFLLPGIIAGVVFAASTRPRLRFLVGGAIVAIVAAPLGLLTVNRTSDLDRRISSTDVAGLPFVGAQLLDPARVLHPDFHAWRELFDDGYFASVMPWLVVGSGLLAMAAGRRLGGFRWLACGVLSLLYAGPTIGIAMLTSTDQPRYLLAVHPIAFIAIGLAIRLILPCGLLGQHTWIPSMRAILAAGLALIVASHTISGLSALWKRPVIGPDYVAAFAFVRAHRLPSEPVIVSLPAVARLELDDGATIVFLAGSEESVRTQRYTWRTSDGRMVDFWLGGEAIVSTREFCAALSKHPDAWLVVDEQRIGATWAYGGSMRRLILGLTYRTFRAPGGAVVRRVAPSDQQIPAVQQTCQDATRPAEVTPS
ncbi:MAG: hypothetical protein KatS3mg059_1317 [Thermomicrobiales bacterium]|nr:MAG: hypothetical protein KatS3mg059_1317 [Thermomicrobiales bacterium]